MLRFSHGDQMIAATLDGSGIAMGGRPHLTRQLQDGVLCAPLGPDAVAHMGSFFIVVRPDAATRNTVENFVSWLRSEARRDSELVLAAPHPKSRAARSPVKRASSRAS
jgi:DNA-binding transcriptional LysR family regulator